MPKKKTGQRKKAEKQKARQKEIGAKSKYISTQIILDRYCGNIPNTVYKILIPWIWIEISFKETHDRLSNCRAMPIWTATSVKENRKTERSVTFVKAYKG